MDTVLAEKLSALVQYQLPDFVRDNYETFQAFLVAYYEFLEQDGEAQYVLQNSENYKDIDDTIDSFVDMFLKQYAYDLPESIFLNQETKELLSADTYESKRAIAKHLRQYYASKGSESGVKLLFRLLFDDDITFYYPKEDIFKPSSGVWTKRQTLKLANASSNSIPSGAIITGNSSGAFAIVDKTYLTERLAANANLSILEVQFDKGSLEGTWQRGEGVTIQYGNVTSGNLELYATGSLLNVVSTVDIVTPGFGHKVGDVVTVEALFDFNLTKRLTGIGDANGFYGSAVASSSNYICVGAYNENSGKGNVYVYSPDGTQLYVLQPPSTSTANERGFGYSVGISNDYVVVGSPFTQDTFNYGNIHVYRTSDGSYLRSIRSPSHPDAVFSQYGFSVAVAGSYALVGAPGDDSFSSAKGNAFLLDVSTGSVVKKLQDPNAYGTTFLDAFGSAVAISDNYYAVSAALEDQSGYSDTGRVYVYNRATNTVLYNLINPDTPGSAPSNDFFGGNSISMSDQIIAVGAYGETYGSASQSGIVYIFDTPSGSLLKTIYNPNYLKGEPDQFGFNVSVNGRYVAIGAPGAYNPFTTVYSGKAYVYDGITGTLLSEQYCPSDLLSNFYYGYAVNLGNKKITVGAYYDNRAFIYDFSSVNNFRALVSKTSDTGRIKEIEIENFGNGYSNIPLTNVTPATLSYSGKYKVTANIATVVLFDSTGNSISHGLKANDTVNVTFTSGITLANGAARVNSIISDKRFTLANSNVYYTSSGNITVRPSTATLESTIGALCEYPGTYDTNRDGHVSDIKKLQDGDYYQENSYVIRATKSSYLWKDIIKKTLHPAGLKLFSEIYISTANSIVSVSVEPPNAVYTTIVYLLKLLSTSVVNTLETIQPTTTITLESISRASRNTGDAYAIGPTFQTIDQFKYAYTNLHVYDLANYTLDFFANNINTPTLFAPPDEIFRGNANIILNSTFDDTSTWKLGSGLSITTGNLVGSAATASAWQPFTTAGNVKCMATYEIRRISAGSIALTTNTFSGTSRTTVGNYSEIFFAPHPNGNIILSASGFTGDVDNVYVKVLEPITN